MTDAKGEQPPSSGSLAELRSITRDGDASKGLAGGLGLLVSSDAGIVVVPLHRGTMVLGRAPDADVSIADASISRRHARLRIDDSIMIEDLGSTNGTTVQGRRLDRGERALLTMGTVFELGWGVFVVQRAHDLVLPRERTESGSHHPSDPTAPIVCDPTMRHLYALLDVIAPSSMPVLILGENGVGKEVYAQTIYKRSDRRGAPYLALRCAALPNATLEGELFEVADGGTLFLDEVSELPMATQTELLRILENGDVRVLASTSRDLRQLVVDGHFRADLYLRLNGTNITLPPLRKRQSDITPLATLFLERSSARAGHPAMGLTDSAVEALERHHWPGNVRELANVIERAVALSKSGPLDLEHLALVDHEAFAEDAQYDERTDRYELPPASRRMMRAVVPRSSLPPGGLPDETERLAASDLRAELRSIEKQRILDALTKTAGNQSQAAKLLGMSRYTLMSRLETYAIARPRKTRS